jgi:hypothetical protein
MQEFINYGMVFLWGMFKFIGGIITGKAQEMAPWLTALITSAGMMTSIVVFSFGLGKPFHNFILRKFYKNRKLFTKGNRRKVKIWTSYGLGGVAFLTPILFSPIGGAMIANSFGADKKSIILYMLVSALFWGLVLSYSAEVLGLLVRANPLPQ